MPRILLPMLAALLLIGGCGDDDETTSSPTATTAEETATASPAPAEEVGCEKAELPQPKGSSKLEKPNAALEPGKEYVAVVDTTCGTFEITLDPEQAPKTGGSFAYLAEKGFYDDLIFHRIVPGFVI